MKQPETDTDIEITHSLRMSVNTARWDFRDGRHIITLAVGPIFDEAKGYVEKSRGYTILDNPDTVKWPAYDAYVDAFAEVLHESFLTELVCIERRRQGLRMRHDRCKPCCLARVVAFMVDHINSSLRYSKFPRKAGEA
jgi:hypothetical protein